MLFRLVLALALIVTMRDEQLLTLAASGEACRYRPFQPSAYHQTPGTNRHRTVSAYSA